MKKTSFMKSKKYVTYIKKFCSDKNDENEEDENENDEKSTKYQKVKDHCHYTGKFRGAAHSICNLRCKIPKNILIVIYNAGYDTHFIIEQLAEQFKGEFNCIEKNMEKYITFSVPVKKNVIIAKQLYTS